MKYTNLFRDLNAIADEHGAVVEFVREGGRHEIWRCNGLTLTIPRHRTINERTAKTVKARLRQHLESTT